MDKYPDPGVSWDGLLGVEGIMSSSERDLIDRLQRANRRWRRVALGAITGLVLVLVMATALSAVAYQRAKQARLEAQAQRERAEEAMQDALRQALQARAEVERALYVERIQAAHEAWLSG